MFNNMKKRCCFLVACFMLICITSGISIEAEASDVVVYDASTFDAYKNRTKSEVCEKYSEALLAAEKYDVSEKCYSYYEEPASQQMPGKAGVLSADTHKALTARTNFYRYLAGMPALTKESQHSDKLQAEAFVRNFEYGHYITGSKKPDGVDEDLWNLGFTCTHNGIFLNYAPSNSIQGWIDEVYHRIPLISGKISAINFAHVSYVSLYAIAESNNESDEAFCAWPGACYIPIKMIEDSNYWDIELNVKKISIENWDNIVVNVTDLDSGESYECTTGNGKLIKNSYYSNILIFDPPTDYAQRYRIDVTGLEDVSTGKMAELTYQTEFFDPTEDVTSYASAIGVEGTVQYILPTTLTPEQVVQTLPDTLTLTSEMGVTGTAKVAGEWQVDRENSCFVNTIEKAPERIALRGTNKVTIRYYYNDNVITDKKYMEVGSRTINKSTLWFSVNCTDILSSSGFVSEIYKLEDSQENESFILKQWDSKTYEELYANKYVHKYQEVDNLTEDNTGNYLATIFIGDTAYVTNPISVTADEWGPSQLLQDQPFDFHIEFTDTNEIKSAEVINRNTGESIPADEICEIKLYPAGNVIEITGKGKYYGGYYDRSCYLYLYKGVDIINGELIFLKKNNNTEEPSSSPQNTGEPQTENTDLPIDYFFIRYIYKKNDETSGSKETENTTDSNIANASSGSWNAKVKSLTVKKTKKRTVKVSWKKVKNAKGYQIKYSTGKKFLKKTSQIKSSAKRYCTIKKLKKNNYYFKVRAYKIVNGKKVYGKWSKVKKVKVK